MTDSYGYNGFGEVTSYTAPSFSVTYTRDNGGRITTKAETIQGVAATYDYHYDTAGRLDEVKKDGAVTSTYTYDLNGNRLTHNATTATYDNQDRLLTYGAATFTYTRNGELLSKTDATGTTTYTYDVHGNLKVVALPSGTTITYLVDGQNRRIGKKVNGVLTQGFLWSDQLRIVAELDGTGAVVSRFVYGRHVNVPDYMVRAGVTYRIITDHLGSPRLVVNTSTGAIVQRMDYDEFGNVTTDTNAGWQPFAFAGGLYDVDTKLVRFGARDYMSASGSWAAKDPLRFAGGETNVLQYAAGDSMNFFDPEGRNAAEALGHP